MAIHSEEMSDFPFIGYRGEASLNASKEINDRKLDDAGRRSNGSNVDGTTTHVDTGLELCIVKVSGPTAKSDHMHYINDRKKIAINLKKVFLAILLEKYATSNPSTLKGLVLLGVHMYSKCARDVGWRHIMINFTDPIFLQRGLHIRFPSSTTNTTAYHICPWLRQWWIGYVLYPLPKYNAESSLAMYPSLSLLYAAVITPLFKDNTATITRLQSGRMIIYALRNTEVRWYTISSPRSILQNLYDDEHVMGFEILRIKIWLLLA